MKRGWTMLIAAAVLLLAAGCERWDQRPRVRLDPDEVAYSASLCQNELQVYDGAIYVRVSKGKLMTCRMGEWEPFSLEGILSSNVMIRENRLYYFSQIDSGKYQVAVQKLDTGATRILGEVPVLGYWDMETEMEILRVLEYGERELLIYRFTYVDNDWADSQYGIFDTETGDLDVLPLTPKTHPVFHCLEEEILISNGLETFRFSYGNPYAPDLLPLRGCPVLVDGAYCYVWEFDGFFYRERLDSGERTLVGEGIRETGWVPCGENIIVSSNGLLGLIDRRSGTLIEVPGTEDFPLFSNFGTDGRFLYNLDLENFLGPGLVRLDPNDFSVRELSDYSEILYRS